MNILEKLYKSSRLRGDQFLVNSYWFFSKNMGLTLGYEKTDSKLIATDKSNQKKTNKYETQ
jgi:hypothetical protein